MAGETSWCGAGTAGATNAALHVASVWRWLAGGDRFLLAVGWIAPAAARKAAPWQAPSRGRQSPQELIQSGGDLVAVVALDGGGAAGRAKPGTQRRVAG